MTYICKSTYFHPKQKGKKNRTKLAAARNDVLAFRGDSIPRFDDPLRPVTYSIALLRFSIKEVFKKFKLPKRVRPFHLMDLKEIILKNGSSSAGIPWQAYGYATKRDVLECPKAFQSVRYFWHLIKDGNRINLPHCFAYAKTYIKNGENKMSIVYEYPATVSFAEACFALPLIDAYKANAIPVTYGYEQYLCLNYKNFYKNIPAWLIGAAFNILLINIDITKYQNYGVPNASKLILMWEKLEDYFVKTPIRLANGEKYFKSKGLASGSYFTKLIKTIINCILTHYFIIRCGAKIIDYLILKNDLLVATNVAVDLDQLSFIIRQSGMTLDNATLVEYSSIHKNKALCYRINGDFPPEEL